MLEIKDELIKEFLNDNFNLKLFELKLYDIREISLDLDYIKQAYILGDMIMISRPFYPENVIYVTFGDNVIRTIKFIKEKCSDSKYRWCFYVEKEF